MTKARTTSGWWCLRSDVSRVRVHYTGASWQGTRRMARVFSTCCMSWMLLPLLLLLLLLLPLPHLLLVHLVLLVSLLIEKLRIPLPVLLRTCCSGLGPLIKALLRWWVLKTAMAVQVLLRPPVLKSVCNRAECTSGDASRLQTLHAPALFCIKQRPRRHPPRVTDCPTGLNVLQTFHLPRQSRALLSRAGTGRRVPISTLSLCSLPVSLLFNIVLMLNILGKTSQRGARGWLTKQW